MTVFAPFLRLSFVCLKIRNVVIPKSVALLSFDDDFDESASSERWTTNSLSSSSILRLRYENPSSFPDKRENTIKNTLRSSFPAFPKPSHRALRFGLFLLPSGKKFGRFLKRNADGRVPVRPVRTRRRFHARCDRR